jgi:TonB family protein
MKEIHEFQADENTLNSGIDAKLYQFLIIQKSVGPQRFALANSFNHCQIKKRITMMNKSKTSKAWRWKVATFLPLLALLLMAFSKTGENAPPKQPTQAKQWTTSDFGKPVYDNTTTRAMLGTPIEIDSQSKISIRNKPATLDNVTAIARMNFDYNRADDKLKNEFMKMTVNGQERMFQRYCLLHVFSHSAASPQVLQTVLNAIGKAAEETRQYYALDLFKTDYGKLLSTQKSDIDKLVPAIVVVQNFPIGNPASEATTNAFTAEIKAEGIIVPPSEKAISTVELKKQVESFATGKSNPSVNVKTANGLNGDLLNKVKDILKTVKNINVSYSEFEPVYTLVDQMPEFPDGVVACRDWVAKNTQYPANANIEGKVYVAFVVNSMGKVVSPSIAKGLNSALDTEALRVISAMPTWKPGVQNGIPVCVKYTIPVNFVKK